MKVTSLGFRLKPVGKATIEDLWDRLRERTGHEFTYQGLRRLHCQDVTSDSEEFAAGLLLTIRDHKRFLQIQNAEGKLTVKVTELDSQTSPFDFNFFVIHKQSGSGLYSHYHTSCSLPVFHAYLKGQYIRADKGLEGGKPIGDEDRVRASKLRDLKLQIFLRRDSFEEAVKELREVKRFEYDILSPTSMTSELQPLGSQIKLERRQVRLGAGVSGQTLLARIRSLIPESPLNAQRFRVVGEDSSGDVVPIDLIATPDCFSEDDFDDLADDEVLNLDALSSSSYVGKLLRIFAARRDFFTAGTQA